MVVAPIGKPEPLPKPTVGAVDIKGLTFAVQISETVGAAQVATALVLAVVKLIFVGQLEKLGGVTSGEQGLFVDTVTVKIQGVALLFAASLAV